MHLLEPFADQLERLAEALLQRGVQFFIDRAAHFFKLGGVVQLNRGQALVERHAQLLGILLRALHQPGELQRHGFLQG